MICYSSNRKLIHTVPLWLLTISSKILPGATSRGKKIHAGFRCGIPAPLGKHLSWACVAPGQSMEEKDEDKKIKKLICMVKWQDRGELDSKSFTWRVFPPSLLLLCSTPTFWNFGVHNSPLWNVLRRESRGMVSISTPALKAQQCRK